LTRISWGDPGTRFYETGVDRGVLYVGESAGVAWNGLTSITENSSGGAAQPYYIDGVKYSNKSAREEFEATLTAFTYPDEFGPCDGLSAVRAGLFATKQRRVPFGLAYRTLIGNDVTSDYGYKIHLIYNALAAPTDKDYKSITDSIDPDDFSWSLTSLPPAIVGFNRTSHFIVDSRYIDPTTLSAIEDILYGNDETASRLPDISELTDLIDTGDHLTVTDNGDGTFSLEAPIADLVMLDIGTFQITWDTVIDNGDGTYTASSS
jgi:hypothetical protein